MALHFTPPPVGERTDPADAIARLHAVRGMVASMAGFVPPPNPHVLDESALAAAYGTAPGVVRRRVDALVRETAGFAGTGLAMLSRHAMAPGRRTGAARLAAEMDDALNAIERLLTSSH